MSKRQLDDSTHEEEHAEEEEELNLVSSQEEDDFISHHHPRVQVNPLHAEKIVRQIMAKPNWHSKITSPELVEKWRRECTSQGIAESSFLVAMDILQDFRNLSNCKKSCCGCCGAAPKKMKWEDMVPQQVDQEEKLFEEEQEEERQAKKIKLEEEKKEKEKPVKENKVGEEEEEEDGEEEEEEEGKDEEEEEEDDTYFSRSTKFCLCPCAHCAFEDSSVSGNVCTQHENLIPVELTEKLKQHLNALVANTPKDKLDWHPGSNQQVLDIIHPSLYCYSKKYTVLNDAKQNPIGNIETQWIPTDFEVDSNNKVTPLSYINNINPKTQKDLQDTICEVLSRFIEPVKKFIQFENKVQVIIKAANVIVTPEQGFYPGGTWHTEGDSENIAATGIFYYESQNIKQSFLEFRQSLDEESFYYIEQDNVQQAWEQYNIHDGDKLCEVLGKVQTTEGKCIVFPNEYQHRVKHFFPEDPTKVATRKILVFFFVDPKNPIVSTSNIDNQRRDVVISNAMPLAKLITFPVLVKNVLSFIPFMTPEQAFETREILMQNRKYKRDNDKELYEREFSMCEH